MAIRLYACFLFFSLVLLKEISIKRIISMIEKHSDFFRNEKLVIIKYN